MSSKPAPPARPTKAAPLALPTKTAPPAREINQVPATFVETIEKLQTQGLETLKQAQAVQIATLKSVGEIVASAPTVPAVPNFEKMPSIAELTELSATFTKKLVDQQFAYFNELATVFATAQKDAAAAFDRAVQSASAPK
jgi:hypothetical protein